MSSRSATMFPSASNKVGTQDRNSAPKSRLSLLKQRTVLLGAVSFLSYPLLAGVSWVVNLFTGQGGGWLLSPDPITSLGTYIFAVGLTITVALWFVYAGVRKWSDPLTRSGAKLLRFTVIAIITTVFSFAAFAILVNLVDMVLHTSG